MQSIIDGLYIRSIIFDLSDRTLQSLAIGLKPTDQVAIIAKALLKERAENLTR